jgi:hypothetical protein
MSGLTHCQELRLDFPHPLWYPVCAVCEDKQRGALLTSEIGSCNMQASKDHWTEFGFQDITCDVPPDWDPTHIEGTYEKGYVRLDDPRAPRLEIRWEHSYRGVLLSRTIDNHIKLVNKEARRMGRELRVQRDLSLGALQFEEREFFSYKNHIQAIGLATRCRTCGRVLILRVFDAKGGKPLRPIAVRIFQSLRDHPEEGKSRWSLYGLRFDVPDRFRLVSHDLKTGRLRFDFVHRGAELTIARAALAGIVLKERSLAQWLDEAMPKLFRGFDVESRSEEFRGHESLVYSGRYKLRLRLTRLMVRPWFLYVRVWHCEASDKIYVFRVVGPEKDRDSLEKCLDLVYCH